MTIAKPEPWLRGTHGDVGAVPRAAIHAMELAQEDLMRWCSELNESELTARPFGLPSVAFQMRHIARSVDRLLTYAEGRQLEEYQLERLRSENDSAVSRAELFGELSATLSRSQARIRALAADSTMLEQARAVGRKSLPTTLGGLLVHVAEHTQRHVGQAITTVKILAALRSS